MKSYCEKRKKVTECVPASEEIGKTRNGRFMLKCICVECGITKTRFVKSQKGTGVLDKPLEAADWADKITRKLIPSTDHIFDRYWSSDILKGAFTGPTGITSKKFWSHPKKGTIMPMIKNPKTGKYENVYVEP